MDGGAAKASRNIRAELGRAHVERALDMVRRHVEAELRDTACAGLCIRVRKTEAVWSLRGRIREETGPRQSTWRIGTVERDDQPREVRAIAVHGKALLDEGVDPSDWMREQLRLARGGTPRPVVPAVPVTREEPEDRPAVTGPRRHPGDPEHLVRPPPGGLPWPVARDAWLAEVKRTLSEASWVSYKNFVLSPHIGDRWDNMTLREFMPHDFKQLQVDIAALGHKRQHRGVLTALKACFSWLAGSHPSGIEDSPAAGVKALKPPRSDEDDEDEDDSGRVPTVQELGTLAWRLQAIDCMPQVRLGIMLLALSAQRIRSTRLARIADFEDLGEGVGCWGIPAPRTKAKVPHAVPLGPLGWSVVQSLRQMAGNKPLLLAKTRLRRAGDDEAGPMAWKTIGAALATALPGVTPHAMRRAFATLGETECGNTRLETALVLHHGNEKSAKAEGAPTVTALRYALHDRRHEKWSPMLRWEEWLVARLKAAAPAGHDWPGFLARPDCYR